MPESEKLNLNYGIFLEPLNLKRLLKKLNNSNYKNDKDKHHVRQFVKEINRHYKEYVSEFDKIKKNAKWDHCVLGSRPPILTNEEELNGKTLDLQGTIKPLKWGPLSARIIADVEGLTDNDFLLIAYLVEDQSILQSLVSREDHSIV